MSSVDPASVTVADLLAHGVDAVEAACPECAFAWKAPVSFLPSTTNLQRVSTLLLCPRCGERGIRIKAGLQALGLL